MTVKELRKLTGLSQSKFANYMHIGLKNIQHWEQGVRTPPPYVTDMMERIIRLEGTVQRQEDVVNKEREVINVI